MVGFDDNYDSDPNLSNEVYIIEDEEGETTWREEELNIEPNLVSIDMDKHMNQHPTIQSIHIIEVDGDKKTPDVTPLLS